MATSSSELLDVATPVVPRKDGPSDSKPISSDIASPLREVFEALDSDGDESLSFEEFHVLVQNLKLACLMKDRGDIDHSRMSVSSTKSLYSTEGDAAVPPLFFGFVEYGENFIEVRAL